MIMFEPLRKYAEFSGRARRKEYWLFTLFYIIVLFGVASVSVAALPLFWIVLLIPGAALTVRRLHDIDASGWWSLLLLIPVIGPIAIIVCACLDGTSGDNRFGADPKGR